MPIVISVVTVVRNSAILLERTIKSVERQTYANLEYIVVDGGSTDGSFEVAQSSGKVAACVSEPDKGIYDAMNKGARLAKGDWVLFMNAGDTFATDDVVSTLAKEAAEYPQADVVYGDVVRMETDGSENLKVASGTLKAHRLAFCHQSVMCRRILLLSNPFDIKHRYSADFKFFKILQKQRRSFHHADFPVAKFDTSGISTSNRSQGLADNIKVVVETDGIVKGLPAVLHLLPSFLLSKLRGK